MTTMHRAISWLFRVFAECPATPVEPVMPSSRKARKGARRNARRRRGFVAIDAQSSILGQIRYARTNRGL